MFRNEISISMIIENTVQVAGINVCNKFSFEIQSHLTDIQHLNMVMSSQKSPYLIQKNIGVKTILDLSSSLFQHALNSFKPS
mmetsp:Transcript_31323/g.62079  ORF Transcript_31323/g.62079 Transcript_31323/m.62079 type:complete len:82 (+) Transcript_31323:151-396(+)